MRVITKGYTTFREAIAAPIAGAACAGYLTKPFIHYLDKMGFPLPTPDPVDSGLLAAGFIVGVCGMWIADFILLKVGSFLNLNK